MIKEKRAKEKHKRFGIKRKWNACQAQEFDKASLQAELLREAQTLKIPAGAAEIIAVRVAERVEKWAMQRPAVTLNDINHRVASEVEKYSRDLAYVYQNRDKII